MNVLDFSCKNFCGYTAKYNDSIKTATLSFNIAGCIRCARAGLYSSLGHRFFSGFVELIKQNPSIQNIMLEDNECHQFKDENVNIFKELFTTEIKINPEIIEMASSINRSNVWVHHGLYNTVSTKHKVLYNLLYAPSLSLQCRYNFLLQKYSLNLDTTLGVCIRGTDKGREVVLTSVENWIKKTKEYLSLHPIEKILLQTDDSHIQRAFINYFGNECVFFNENVVTNTRKVVHLTLENGKRTEFTRNMDATCRILANCRYLINHTGNTGCAIMYYRNNTQPNFNTVLDKKGNFYTF